MKNKNKYMFLHIFVYFLSAPKHIYLINMNKKKAIIDLNAYLNTFKKLFKLCKGS